MQFLNPSNPLAWVDEDRLLLKDRTRYGLHRRVIARKNQAPSAELWLEAVAIYDQVERERLTHWYVKDGEFWYLWITWKEPAPSALVSIRAKSKSALLDHHRASPPNASHLGEKEMEG